MGSQNATLTSQAQQAVNKQINQAWLNSQNDYSLFSQFSNGLSNLGIMSGNSTLSQLGQFGNTLNNFSPVMQNWSKLSSGQKLQGGAGIGGAVADGLDNMLFSKQHVNDSALTKGLNSAYDTASNTLMMFSPVGTIVGGAMKVGKFLGDGLSALGVGTDQMTTTDQILDSNFMKLTPVGLVNGIGAKKSKDFSINQDTIEKVGSSYGGSVNTIQDAQSKANKKYGLFSSGARKKANALIDKANTQQNIMTDISDTYQDQLANKSDLAYTRYGMNLNGGYQQQYVRSAKYGAILSRINLRKHKQGGQLNSKINVDTKEFIPTIQLEQETPKFQEGGELNTEVTEWEPTIQLDILEFKDGGKSIQLEKSESKEESTKQQNVIPEGALHAHKHHMENADELTTKGIPVIDNKGEQQAEIERNEIIFNLEVTKKLEELNNKFQKEGTSQKEKDELAIEAGKLLVNEILYNTIDRTGLIKECKKGGTLNESK